MTDNDLILDPGVKTTVEDNPVSQAPSRMEALRFSFTDAPRGETDESKAVKAEYLGNVYFDLLQKARQGIDPNKDDSFARAEAVYFSEAMTGQKDVSGKLWQKGGFKTGREYLQKMHDFFLNGGEKNLTKKWKEFDAKPYDQQVAEALGERKTLDFISHAVGSAAESVGDFFNRRGESASLTKEESVGAPDDVLAASKILVENEKYVERSQDARMTNSSVGPAPDAKALEAASKTVSDWRTRQYNEKVRAEYAAKLLSENAWYELSAILPNMTENGRACAKALMDSKDNRLPETMWAKFNALDDKEKELVCRARTCLAPRVEGNVLNTAGDMIVGAMNVASNVLAAPYRFGNKLGMMASNKAFDAGFDVNELARRRQYLWRATGRFDAGSAEGGYLPQMQFEQICQDHGFLAESLIGAVSTLPYMAVAALPGIGVATVAMEAMNEMDDHVALNGGDITDPDYIVSSAIFGALYAYTERLQVEKLLGDVGDLKLRESMLKGFFAGIKDRPAVKAVTVGTISESVQEGLQNGIMQMNEALALDQDALRAFAEGFTQDFVGSLGTMFVVEAGGLVGGHWQRSGFNNGFTEEGRRAGRAHRSADLESIYEADMSKARIIDYSKDMDVRSAQAQATESVRLHEVWAKEGKGGILKEGVDPVRAEEWDYYFSSLTKEAKEEYDPDIERANKAAQDIADFVRDKVSAEFQLTPEEAHKALAASFENIAAVRNAWARGAGIAYRTQNGNVIDAGAKEIEKMGFTPEYAAKISNLLNYERAAAYSPAALEGIRDAYEKQMGARVGSVVAMAKQFGGQLVNAGGNTYLKFDRKEGTQLVQIVESSDNVDFESYDEGLAVSIANATDGKMTKTVWKKMTPEERKAFWNDNFKREGNFKKNDSPIEIILPADPSARITSEQAAQIIGTINISKETPNARVVLDSSAVFHETYHAFSYFAQASGLWTKEDADYLAKHYGNAKSSGETHNEEKAAEGFREFLARRASGALTADDEKSPFAKIYAAAAGLDDRANEKAAQENVATEAEKNFFDQLVADANAIQDEKKEPAKEETKTEPVKETTETHTHPAEPVKETTETYTRPKTWTAFTPTGNVKVSGHWAVYDLAEIVHSNNPLYAIHMRAQLRDRKDNKAEEDTRNDIVNNFQGERLLEAPDTANGAPIVFIDRDENGVQRPFVLSGNGRVLVLNELANRHLYDHYRNVMKKWAAENGIAVPEGETPVLVRVIDDFGGSNRDKIADLSNTNSIQQYNEEEQARADAEIIKALDLAKLYKANADGTPDMTPGVNDDFFNAFIRGVGDTSLYNSDRTLTQAARDRAQRALLAIAVGQGKNGRDVVKKLVEQTDTLGMTRQKNAAAIMAAPVAALEKKPAYAIGADVSRAMADYMDFAEKKKAGKTGTFDEYERQEDMLDPRSPIANEIFKLFGSGKPAAAMAEYVKTYCRAAEMEDPNGGLFGAARTREEIWKDAAKTVDENTAEKRYSVKKIDDTVRRKDLLAVHNLRSDAIKSVAEMGGFAMPSIAVVKDAEGHKEFGDVTVLFGKETIDPKKNRQNALYSHDAWTPTFPEIFNKIDEKGISKTNERLVGTIPENVKNVIKGEGYKLAYTDGIHDAFDHAEDAADAYARNILMKTAYLVAKGEKVEPVLRDKTYLKNVHMRLELIGENGLKKLHERLGKKLIEIYEGPGSESVKKYEELAPEIEEIVKDAVWERDFKDDPKVIKGGYTKEQCVGNYFTDNHLNWAEISDIAESVYKYDEDLKNGKLGEKIPDEWKTKDAISKRVDEKDPEYRAWINAQYENPILGKGVYNGKERFTTSGNRRSWEALHDPATLDNIIKAMKKTQRANGAGILGRNPFGVAVKKFKSIKDLVENEDILKPLTRDEEGKIREELGNRLSEVLTEYQDTQKSPDDNQFIARDRALEMMFDAYEEGRGGFTAMKALLNGWGYSADDDLVQRIKNVFDDMSVMATNYFEAKPQRAVRFDEMKAWIVPDTISKENRKSLEDNGQRIFTYKEKDEEDRLRAVNEAADRLDTRFSVKEIDKNIDDILSKFDEAKGKSKKEIINQYDNEQKIIAVLPENPELPDQLKVDNPVVKGAQAYILNHLINQKGHEYKYTADDAKRVIKLIDPTNEIRIVPQRGSLSMAFIGKNPKAGWDCIVIAPHSGEFYVFKTMFGQKRKPYQDKPKARYSIVSVRRDEAADLLIRGGLSSVRDFTENGDIVPQSSAESKGRNAVKAYAQESVQAAEDALENYVAYFKLSHGSIPRPQTLARIGLSLGMNVVDPKRILKNADRLADRAKGTLIERAAKNGDLGTAMSVLKREKDIEKTVENLIAGGVTLGGKLTHKGVGQVNTLLQKRIDRMMADMNAATLADMEGETGLDLAAEILTNNPDAFDVEYRKAKKTIDEAGKDENQEDWQAGVPDIDIGRELSDSERYKRAELLKEANEKVARFIEEAKTRAEDNKRKTEERRRRIMEIGSAEETKEGQPDTGKTEDPYNPTPTVGKANFKTPGEFAAFLRVWAQNKFAQTHGLTTLGQVEQDRLFGEFYRLCAKQELQDLADKLLAPTDETGKPNAKLAKLGAGSRVWVNRRLAEMEKGLTPDRIERISADIFAFINKAAIRVSRVDLITSFKAELKERFLEGAEFEELKADTERKLTGWVEEATRYICRVCDLSKQSVNGDSSQLEKEYQRLHEIIDRRQQVYDESGKEVAAAAQEDAETLKAQWMLALLDKYGAMRSLMPGEILDLQNDAFDYLENEAKKLEDNWKETREEQEQVRKDYSAAIVGPNGQKYESKGPFAFFERLFDGLNGLIRLRMKHLTRFATEAEKEKANAAINSILVRLGDGETDFARALQTDRDNLFAGLANIFQKDGKADNAAIKRYLERMDEKIPAELARQISNQGYAESMTYGQMLQLLVSLEQRSFKNAIEANGREGQAELIRSFTYADEEGRRVHAFTREDDAFVDFLRAFYAAKRDDLSEVTMRMVGHKVDSPDPLYCPVRRWIDDKARALHADPTQRWDPISKIFSRRIESDRDFDESRTILGLFYENSRESAKLTAWAERGSFIRNVVTSPGFQACVKRAFGPGELGKILKQLEATFNGGEVMKETPAELAAVDKALNFTTYAYLGFNPLSAAKQTTSFTVWANALPGGFRDLWRHMTHFDKDVVKHLKESEEYKVRYGNDVGSGQDMATKGLNSNPSSNPFMRTISGAGMWLLKKGDFAPGIWIAQGVYKDLLNQHLKEGMDAAAADKRAITETFNMLEETQQSGRTYNTNMLTIEHGRIGRLLTQFATSPLQQLQYETQALREWRDMVKYRQGEEKVSAARQKFFRAALINHVLLPAALNLVITMYKAAMGEEPPWEKDGYHWTLLTEVLMGQFSRVFFLGAFADTTLRALFKRETPRAGQLLPVEGMLGMGVSAGILVHDLATMNVDNIQKDLERAIKGAAPTRIPYNVYRRLTGDADVDRKAKKKKAKRK